LCFFLTYLISDKVKESTSLFHVKYLTLSNLQKLVTSNPFDSTKRCQNALDMKSLKNQTLIETVFLFFKCEEEHSRKEKKSFFFFLFAKTTWTESAFSHRISVCITTVIAQYLQKLLKLSTFSNNT
jgi:hypothetical protein